MTGGHEDPAAEVRVLLVDDDDEDAMLARALLQEAERTRYAVRWAADADEALRAIEETTFEVILLDLRIGPDSGLDLLDRLRARGVTTPVVMMTSATDPSLDDRAMRAGASDWLVKGKLDAWVLDRTIRYALEHHRQRAQLAAVVRRQNEILGMAAHDLRSPLGVVHAYATFLRDRLERIPVVEQRELIERMGESVRFMVTLIDDLLDLSSIESGTVSLAVEETDVRALVLRLVEHDRLLARPKEIAIVVEAADRPHLARVDPRRFQQVLQNLLGNATKYSHPGGEIRIELGELDASVRVSVRDQGTGIAPDFLERIFAPFARERREGTHGERSTGLGLAIVRRIVDAHGGRIWVESAPGEGSTFHVEVPGVDGR